jgi:hydrogenase maturation factor
LRAGVEPLEPSSCGKLLMAIIVSSAKETHDSLEESPEHKLAME